MAAALPPANAKPTSYHEAYEHEHARAERAENRAESAQSRIKEAADETLHTGIIAGTALAGGYAQGRYGHKQEVFGLPGVTMVSAMAVGGIAFNVGGRKYRRYLVSVAQGGLACTAALFGLQAGEEDAEENVAGVGAGRRGLHGARHEALRERDDDIPPNLPPGLRNLYQRRRNTEPHRVR